MIALSAADCAFSVFIDMIMACNNLDIFKRQYIGVHNAVRAVKCALVTQHTAESRLFIFAGPHFGIGRDIIELAAG